MSSAKTRQVRRMAGRLAVVTVPAARAASIFSEEVGDGVDGNEAEVDGSADPNRLLTVADVAGYLGLAG
ncbi:hypothetical protein [Streptomyces sp. MB09-02B]|uniref:hypothetical protein n=1 Tax=Streptomyces sp. MB09-02B TaxID=3028667 RepID=UPI0029AD138F|nr:hypothetical protein [Streptomyces sp. MB09-02B]MDX3641289.1 hypothetical protein [Streptomyces sp. MB09-02B]